MNEEPAQEQVTNDEASQVAWWMRWLATGAGIIGGVTASLGAIIKFAAGGFLHITVWIGCILMLLLGFLMFALEATFLCRAVKFAEPIVSRSEQIRFWHRGAIYCGLSLIAFITLASDSPLSTLGALLIPFATGVLYGLMSLGRKADREQMLGAARGGDNYQQFQNEP